VLGVVEPGAEAAAKASRSGRIVVLATESTARDGAYERAIHRLRPDAAVVSQGCSVFVALAEEGWSHGPIAELVAREYLRDVLSRHRPDCLVLGCTHFPVLIDAIASVAGREIAIVDSARTAAIAVRHELQARSLAAPTDAAARVRLFATDSPDRFQRVASRFLGAELSRDDVELVDLAP
jgi:glutamate racemase